jgi:hypothetical protein
MLPVLELVLVDSFSFVAVAIISLLHLSLVLGLIGRVGCEYPGFVVAWFPDVRALYTRLQDVQLTPERRATAMAGAFAVANLVVVLL